MKTFRELRQDLQERVIPIDEANENEIGIARLLLSLSKRDSANTLVSTEKGQYEKLVSELKRQNITDIDRWLESMIQKFGDKIFPPNQNSSKTIPNEKLKGPWSDAIQKVINRR